MSRPDRSTEVPHADDAETGIDLPAITDDYMRSRLGQARSYALLVLRRTPLYRRPDCDAIVWEHGRRNMALQRSGLMPIVCPVRDDSDLAGIGILTVSPQRATEIFSQDPGVRAGVFDFAVHPISGFPGAMLPIDAEPPGVEAPPTR